MISERQTSKQDWSLFQFSSTIGTNRYKQWFGQSRCETPTNRQAGWKLTSFRRRTNDGFFATLPTHDRRMLMSKVKKHQRISVFKSNRREGRGMDLVNLSISLAEFKSCL